MLDGGFFLFTPHPRNEYRLGLSDIEGNPTRKCGFVADTCVVIIGQKAATREIDAWGPPEKRGEKFLEDNLVRQSLLSLALAGLPMWSAPLGDSWWSGQGKCCEHVCVVWVGGWLRNFGDGALHNALQIFNSRDAKFVLPTK